MEIDDMPDWVNPANDRNEPRSDEVVEILVNDFIKEFPTHYKALVKKDGEIVARMILKKRFKDIN
jgi:hypothetical protein